MSLYAVFFIFFFFNDTPTTEIYTLSLHDALPIYVGGELDALEAGADGSRQRGGQRGLADAGDRKSTRLNSSHRCISYAVFCLKKKKPTPKNTLVIDKTKIHALYNRSKEER